MNITFLGQGYEPESTNSVGNHLLNFLSQKDFHTFTGISAFASEAGIFGLSNHIESAKPNFKNLNLIVGIDQEGTSKEALEEILNLNINSYIFYQSETPIFHPKIYLFEGEEEIKLILGSSNLTGAGLFRNVESSLLIEFDINDSDGLALLNQLKTYYESIFNFSDDNLFKISTDVIVDFVAKGIVPNEVERRRIYSSKMLATKIPVTNPMVIPKRSTAKIPSAFPKKPIAVPQAQTPPIPTPTVSPTAITQPVNPVVAVTPHKVLVWEKNKLSQSDAQNVPNGTAPTGNLKLSQAGFRINNLIINQTTYFRNQVFGNLNWVKTKPNTPSYEEAFGQFDITILGTHIGSQTLKLSHDSGRIAGQGNTPTWLHWGHSNMQVLQQTNITGKTLKLFESNQTFYVDIV